MPGVFAWIAHSVEHAAVNRKVVGSKPYLARRIRGARSPGPGVLAWIAHSVEHAAVNRKVVGSKPTLGDSFF